MAASQQVTNSIDIDIDIQAKLTKYLTSSSLKEIEMIFIRMITSDDGSYEDIPIVKKIWNLVYKLELSPQNIMRHEICLEIDGTIYNANDINNRGKSMLKYIYSNVQPRKASSSVDKYIIDKVSNKSRTWDIRFEEGFFKHVHLFGDQMCHYDIKSFIEVLPYMLAIIKWCKMFLRHTQDITILEKIIHYHITYIWVGLKELYTYNYKLLWVYEGHDHTRKSPKCVFGEVDVPIPTSSYAYNTTKAIIPKDNLQLTDFVHHRTLCELISYKHPDLLKSVGFGPECSQMIADYAPTMSLHSDILYLKNYKNIADVFIDGWVFEVKK